MADGSPTPTFTSFAPATGEALGDAPNLGVDAVREVVARAKKAQAAWGALPVEARAERLLVYRDAFVNRADELVDLLVRECGKPKHEALVHEVMVVADFATYFAKQAPHALAPRSVDLHLMKHRTGRVSYTPRGVVGVISPWNFPLNLPMRDALLALVAGNAVVVKPSEATPLIALRAKAIWDDAGLPPDVFQVVTGFGPTGAALVDAGIQMLVFTGGVATGKRVAAACGERLIPCVMELGGKAPLLACADADLERTARAIVYGGLTNAGQVCISVERVYAHTSIHDELLQRVVDLTKTLRQGDPQKGIVDIGAMIFEPQIGIVERHVEDALKKGARLLTGGKRGAPPGQWFEPTVLSGCTHEMTVMTEEIFGPLVPFMRVSDDEEAIRLANASHLGLNAYVFSKDREKGERIAERIQAGSVLINDVVANGGIPDLPFGGVKNSGFGRVMGEDSMRDMCDTKSIVSDRLPLKDEPIWYPYTERTYKLLGRGMRALFTRAPLARKIAEWF